MGGESYVQAAKDPAPWGGCGVLLSLSLLDLAAGVEDKSGLGVSIRPNVLQFEAAERAGDLEVSDCHLFQAGAADGAAHRQRIGFHIVELACALGVQSDDLLFDRGSERSRVLAELSDTLERCTSQQLRILTDIVKAAKISLDKYQQP